jgi:hypothetical protein
LRVGSALACPATATTVAAQSAKPTRTLRI